MDLHLASRIAIDAMGAVSVLTFAVGWVGELLRDEQRQRARAAGVVAPTRNWCLACAATRFLDSLTWLLP